MSKNQRSAQYDPAQAVAALGFEEVIGAVHEGNFVADCERKVRECTEHVIKRGGKTRVTVTLDFAAAAGGGVTVVGQVAAKLPPPAGRSQFLYADRKGELYAFNPEEVELELAMEQAKPPTAEYSAGEAKVTKMPRQA